MEGSKLEWKKVFKEIILGKNAKNNFYEEQESKDISTFDDDVSSSDENISQNNSIKSERSGGNERTIKAVDEARLKYFRQKQNVPSCTNLVSDDESPEKAKETPEWDKVFKDILGDKRSFLESTANDYIPPPVPYKPVKSKSFYPKKKYSPAFKSKEDKEAEEKVRKAFESWRVFKKQTSDITLNDFDGAGINVFKYSSKNEDLYSVPKQSHRKTNLKNTDYNSCKFFKDKQYHEELTLNDFDGAGINIFKYSAQQKALYSVPKQHKTDSYNIHKSSGPKICEPYYPLTGVVAVPPCQKNSPRSCMELEEVWDDSYS